MKINPEDQLREYRWNFLLLISDYPLETADPENSKKLSSFSQKYEKLLSKERRIVDEKLLKLKLYAGL
jgi:hypothetical protein